MLEPLLGSTNAERVLLFILTRDQGYASEIAKFFDTDLYGIQKQMDKLESGGVLISYKAGKTVLFQFNPRYAFLKELRTLLDKALAYYPQEEQDRLRKIMRIPAAAGHPFRFEPDTDSDFGRTLIPESPDTCSGASGHP